MVYTRTNSVVGFIPLTSYKEANLSEWLQAAQSGLTEVGFNIIMHSGDNSATHQAHFQAELLKSVNFPLQDWRFGIAGIC